jgi:signal transduction histidine kinase
MCPGPRHESIRGARQDEPGDLRSPHDRLEAGPAVDAVVQPSAAGTPRRSGATIGWALGALTLVLVAATVALDIHTGSSKQLVYSFIATALALLGVLMTTRRPDHPVSWVLAGTALLWAGGGFAHTYAVDSLVETPGSPPGGEVAAWIDNWAWLPTIALPIGVLLLLVPDGRLPTRRWRVALVAVLAGTALAALGQSASATFELDGTSIDNPLAVDATVAGIAFVVGGVAVVAGVIASFACFVSRYRHSSGDARQQLRWVGLSLAVAFGLGLVGTLTWEVFPYAYVLYALATLALPAGTAVAVLRYRLYEIDLVVNRAAVYGVLTVCVVLSYVLVVGLVGSLLSDPDDVLLSLAVTGLVAVGIQPARERVQRFVNRLMYGERDDPYAALARLGRRLEASLDVEAVLPTVVETIGQTLRLRYVAVSRGPDDIADNGAAAVAAAYGTPDGTPLSFPLLHNGVQVGDLQLAPRPGERLREEDRRLVADLAPHVAAAVHAVGLTEELQGARRRLVGLREEERRRIRRDLHDGLGPALAGLNFTLDAVRNVAPSDLERADGLLASATDQVQTMIGDVRRLIYGLRPPALDELGLVAALRGLAAREGPGVTRIHVEAPEAVPPLEAALEVATYRIAQEALTNVARHAGARTCTVRLSLEPTALVLEVADDGRGFSQSGTGVGLHTMRERAAELGGTCTIASTTGAGTTITARLPREIVT